MTIPIPVAISEGCTVLDEIGILYDQAEAVKGQFCDLVLDLAVRSRGLLPRLSLGFSQVPSSRAGGTYSSVTDCTRVEEIAWAGLK